ncbi:coiled-coil domain-containing protein 74A-like isoform X1 [Onthophagus taurus]|uniref:coiled-coil domain-containing protein 74A-like isoform X1 n=1 Tax=Onthophagus taurus TaxID=166361 RepID=UPI0039BECE1B
MRNLKYSRSSTLVASQRRVALNNVVLPPLPVEIAETGAEILHKILVNKSKQPGTVNADIVSVARSQDAAPKPSDLKSQDSSRVAQLEQNIKFLQEQHQLMLNGLHHEVDSLRHRNRELQFQLVFAKTSLPTTPTSPDEEAKQKSGDSPKQLNVTPLQIEILEKELSDLKLQLQEVESKNSYLTEIIEEQKMKLEKFELEKERDRERVSQPDPELVRKLDDAEALIRRLRRENSDLRREGSSSPSRYASRDSIGYQSREHNSQQKNTGSQNRGNGRHRGQYRNWFPPVHSQNYWQTGRSVDKTGGSLNEGTSLPNLQGGNSTGNNHQRQRGNNNHYHNEGRKYRGGHNRGNKQT